ncbi:MAG: glutathione S-transferase family protein [Gammaproteobacteria bacterium]|nr:glutathione S-transferase family protein [Gammaproteobacteria bacterium]
MDNTIKESFHSVITADGSSGFKAEADRYHLYISLACPWACRTLIVRKLKKLENIISLSIVDPVMGDEGWHFSENAGCIPDFVNHKKYLSEIYEMAQPDFSGRVSVPVLWDKKTKTIVNNESPEIIRMFNSEFNVLTDSKIDLYPAALRAEINVINQRIFENINLGVYKAGFANTQKEYDTAFKALFAELDYVENLLSQKRYLTGDQITEADWRLFTTLIRFDAVYYVHFKCNFRRIIDYPNIINYVRELYQYPGIKETVNFDHIKRHYYLSHTDINPKGIVPLGPELHFDQPHNRSNR